MGEISKTIQGGMITLDDLAVQAQMFSCGAAMNLLQLGRVLTEAKPMIPHGEWREWVEINAHMPERRAQEYMQAYRKFGIDQRIAQLGPSQIIALLPMTDEERGELLAKNDVSAMTNRELKEAIRAQREELRAEVRAEAVAEAKEDMQAVLDAAEAAEARSEEALKEAEARIAALEGTEPSIPQEILDELEEARKSSDHFAELARKATSEKAQIEREKRQAEADLAEANDILREQQEAMNRAQEELLNLKSAQARGDSVRPSGDDLTIEVFGRAVREFIGLVARMPYMQTTFGAMPQSQKQEYSELLRTVEGWAEGSRRALESVAVEGGVIIG